MKATGTAGDQQVSNHELIADPFWGRLVREVGRAVPVEVADEYDREDKIFNGLCIVEAAARAVNENWWSRKEGSGVAGWHHRSHPVLAGKKRLDPYITVAETETATAAYLNLPYRVESLDRLLVDMLIAAEMFAFADEVQPQLKQKLPIGLGWIWGNVKNLVIGLPLAAFLYWIAPDSTLMNWVAGIVAGVTLLFTFLSVVLFPFFYPSLRTQRQKFHATIMGMRDAYTTLNGSPASVPHIRKMVDRATDAGVIWPAPLMALLDDIASRRSSI